MDLTQSHLRTSFHIFSIVFPFLLIEVRHRVSLTLYIIYTYWVCQNGRTPKKVHDSVFRVGNHGT
jgi:hypothetical protein